LSIYAQARQLQDDYRRLPRPRQLLALGDPAYGGTDGEAVRREAKRTLGRLSLADMGPLWVPLPGTRREVEALGRLFPDQADVFVREKASKQTLQRLQTEGQLKNYRYLHLAAHGFVSEVDAGLSGIVLAQTGLPANSDGYVTASEWPMFDLRTELTVLSACDTGLGRQVTGEGVLGLPFALQLAGSANTLMSLWPVDDDATALLMQHLYQALARGATPADALMQAKRQLATHPRWNAARFWAPFVLVGAG
jgi:CHAT domain-containing protein